MKAQSLTDRTIHSFLWLFVGKGGQVCLNFAVLMVLARHVTPQEFGVIGAASIVVAFSQIFGEIGIGPALVRMPDINSRFTATGFVLSFILGCAVGALVAMLAPAIALFFRMPELEQVVRVLALIFPITGLSVVAQSLMRRELRFRRIAFIEFTSYLIGYGAVGVPVAILGGGMWALVLAQLTGQSLKTILSLILERGSLGVALHGPESRELLHFGGGFSLSRVASYVALQADNLIVGRFMGPEALGLYGRAYQFLMAPTNLLGTLTDNVLFPAMASVQTERERLCRAYGTAMATIAMLTFPLSALLVTLAPELIVVLLGPRWDGVIIPFQILAAVLVFRASYKVSSCLVRATGKVYQNAWRQWFYALAVIVGAWAGHFVGLGGVAAGVSSAIVFNYFMLLSPSLRITGLELSDVAFCYARHLVVALAAAIVATACKSIARDLGWHPSLTIAFAASAAAAAVAILWMTAHRLFGAEGAWLASILRARAKAIAA